MVLGGRLGAVPNRRHIVAATEFESNAGFVTLAAVFVDVLPPDLIRGILKRYYEAGLNCAL